MNPLLVDDILRWGLVIMGFGTAVVVGWAVYDAGMSWGLAVFCGLTISSIFWPFLFMHGGGSGSSMG